MIKSPHDMTSAEMQDRLDQGETHLSPERRLERQTQLRRQADAARKLRDAGIPGAAAQTHNDLKRLMEDAGENTVVDAWLPASKGATAHKRFFVSGDFIDFYDLVADVHLFTPEQSDSANQIREKRSLFSKHFRDVLCHAAEDTTYYEQVGAALFDCQFDTRPNRARPQTCRNPRRFRDCLVAEANRFEARRDWRGYDSQLAAHFGECFRILSELIFQSPRGQQPSTNPNAVFVKHIMRLGGGSIRKGLLEPGIRAEAGEAGGGAPSPVRSALYQSIRKRPTLGDMRITIKGVRTEFERMDRLRQKRQQRSDS